MTLSPENILPTPLSKESDTPYYLPTTQDGRTIYPCKKPLVLFYLKRIKQEKKYKLISQLIWIWELL